MFPKRICGVADLNGARVPMAGWRGRVAPGERYSWEMGRAGRAMRATDLGPCHLPGPLSTAPFVPPSRPSASINAQRSRANARSPTERRSGAAGQGATPWPSSSAARARPGRCWVPGAPLGCRSTAASGTEQRRRVPFARRAVGFDKRAMPPTAEAIGVAGLRPAHKDGRSRQRYEAAPDIPTRAAAGCRK